jgi:GNAT superfamily N-acetyltransferase
VIVRLAADADVPAVMALLNDAAAWLESQGSDQWHGGFGPGRIGRIAARGGTYIAWDDGVPAATITTCPAGDPVLWTPGELAEPATYVSKMATAREYADRGLGAGLMAWAVSAAHERGDRWARLDAWRTRAGLHAYYERQGFARIRTVTAPGRNSGALFARLALPQRHPFECPPSLTPRAQPVTRPLGLIPLGAEVFTAGWQRGVVTEIHGPDWSHGETAQQWEHGPARPSAIYSVRLDDGREILALEGDVTEAASVASAAHV